jgi:hypothetical protein
MTAFLFERSRLPPLAREFAGYVLPSAWERIPTRWKHLIQ